MRHSAAGIGDTSPDRSVPYARVVTDVWDEFADGWDDQPGTGEYAGAAFDSLLTVLGGAGIALRGACVVDFGCGTGLLTEKLIGAGAEVIAVDTSPAMLAALREKADTHGWAGLTATTDLDAVSEGTDLIVCSSVCAFLDDYPATAARLAGLLRPGGTFVQWDWEREKPDDHGLTRREVQDALQGAGLERIEVATAFEVDVAGQTMRPLIGYGSVPLEPSADA